MGGVGAMPQARTPIPAYAEGTPDRMGMLMSLLALLQGRHPGGPALVGEEGPEVVDLPAGSSVTPNPATMARQGGVPQYAKGTPDWLSLLRAFGPQVLNDPRLSALMDMPSYANGTPNMDVSWIRDAWRRGRGGGVGREIRRRHDQALAENQGLPPGWEERGGGRESDMDLSSMFSNGKISYPQLLNMLTAKSIQGGAFDPLGSEPLAQMSRDRIMASQGARERAATLGADMDSGGDPALRAFGRLQARMGTQGDSANAYANALQQSAMQNQQFLQNLFGGRQGAILKKDPKDNTLAMVGGQLGGAAIGAATAGMTGGAGGNAQYVPPDRYSW
jgi:hypothetical protein